MAASPQLAVTDRAYRYRAQKAMPVHAKVCAFCGRKNPGLMVGHVDGHEENGEPSNLTWTCRPCNSVASNTMQAAGVGRLTRQYNPSRSGGASNVGEWAQAVGAISPRSQGKTPGPVGSSDRNSHLRAGSTMSVSDAVAMIRATPHSKRSQFAAALNKNRGRYNPSKRNGPVEDARKKYYSVSFQKQVKAKAKKALASAKKSGAFDFVPSEAEIMKAYANGAQSVREAVEMAGGRLNPGNPGALPGLFTIREAGELWVRMIKSGATKATPEAKAKLIGDIQRAIPQAEEDARLSYGAKVSFIAATNAIKKVIRMRQNPKKHASAKSYRGVVTVYRPGAPPYKRYYGPFADRADAVARVREDITNQRREAQRPGFKDSYKGWRIAGKVESFKDNPARKHSNPALAAIEGYEAFHGREPEEMVTVSRTVHFHKHLSGAGKLKRLVILPVKGRRKVVLSGFGGALLAFNEARSQLFIEGGDQSVDVTVFGINETPHELETLGQVKTIEYFTTKDHLGDEGGTATYVHKFRTTNENGQHVTIRIARYPDLIYRTLDQQLEFSGGSYTILPEGINR